MTGSRYVLMVAVDPYWEWDDRGLPSSTGVCLCRDCGEFVVAEWTGEMQLDALQREIDAHEPMHRRADG